MLRTSLLFMIVRCVIVALRQLLALSSRDLTDGHTLVVSRHVCTACIRALSIPTWMVRVGWVSFWTMGISAPWVTCWEDLTLAVPVKCSSALNCAATKSSRIIRRFATMRPSLISCCRCTADIVGSWRPDWICPG